MPRVFSTAAAVVLLLAMACAPSAPTAPATGGQAPQPASQPKRGGTLKVGIENFDPNLDPTQMGTQYTRQVSNNVFNHLMDLDKNFKVIPELAKSWDIVDDKTIVLKLQTGVKFHDGTPFNAEAVKWNIEWNLDPATKARKRSQFEDIQAVQVVDDSTVKVLLSKVSAALLVNFADTTGYMVSPSAVKKLGQQGFGLAPVGTGPFKFVSMDPNDNITVERNAEYWEPGLPYLDKIIFYKIPDQTVRLNAFRAGNIEMLDFVPPQEIPALKADKSIIYSEVPGVIHDAITFNFKGPFGDIHLRKALAYTIDVAPVYKTVYFESGVADRGWQFPSLWSYNKNLKGIPTDLAKAKEELALAGKPNGFKFILRGAQRLQEQAMAEIVKSQAAKVGIEVDIQLSDSVKSIADTNACNFEAVIGPASTRADPDSGTFEGMFSKGSGNNCGFADAKIDELLLQGRSMYDQAKRVPIYQEIERRAIEDLAHRIVFGHRAEIKVYPPKVKGFVHHPDYILRLKGVWLDQ